MYGAYNTIKTVLSADSLFEKKHYTESLELYERVLHSGFYTPRMLLRLSIIKEGVGDYTYALYYLNLYYSYIHDKAVLKKMDDLASRYNLEGYDYNDMVFFIALYDRYYNYILIAFLSGCAAFLLYLYFLSRKKAKLGLRPYLFMLFLGITALISNYDIVPGKAIISNDASLMSAPSAGAELIGQINKGHRVSIRNNVDIWYEIKWHGKTAYVRENNLLFVEKN